MQKYNELQELLDNADYLVEASSNTVHHLWDKWENVIEFKQACGGFGKNIGDFGGYPVFLSIMYYEIGGKVVVFWEATSMVVNHHMIDAYFKENTKAKYGCADNFHCTIHEIQRSLEGSK